MSLEIIIAMTEFFKSLTLMQPMKRQGSIGNRKQLFFEEISKGVFARLFRNRQEGSS